MTKDEIISELKTVSDQFISDCTFIPQEVFFSQPGDKWSIAQNVTHLTASARMTRLAFQLPKFIIRLYSGRPNRESRTYDELVEKYKLKLQEGGKASGVYVPKKLDASGSKEKIMLDFTQKMNFLVESIEKNWKDHELDYFLAPHPLLGKLTLRELGYFTIYHTLHHDSIIKQRLGEQNQ